MSSYYEFLERKAQASEGSGFAPVFMPDGFELKATYFRQAVKNVEYAVAGGNHFEENFALEFSPEGDPDLME